MVESSTSTKSKKSLSSECFCYAIKLLLDLYSRIEHTILRRMPESPDSFEKVNDDIARTLRELKQKNASWSMHALVECYIHIVQYFQLEAEEYDYYLSRYQEAKASSGDWGIPQIQEYIFKMIHRLEQITIYTFDPQRFHKSLLISFQGFRSSEPLTPSGATRYPKVDQKFVPKTDSIIENAADTIRKMGEAAPESPLPLKAFSLNQPDLKKGDKETGRQK